MKNGIRPLYTNGITSNNNRRGKLLKFSLIIGLLVLGSFGLNDYLLKRERAAFVEKAVLEGWRYDDAFRMWQAIHH